MLSRRELEGLVRLRAGVPLAQHPGHRGSLHHIEKRECLILFGKSIRVLNLDSLNTQHIIAGWLFALIPNSKTQRIDSPVILDATQRSGQFASDVLEAQGIDWELRVPPEVERLKLDPEKRQHLFLIFKEGINYVARHGAGTALPPDVRRWLCPALKMPFYILGYAL